MQDNIAASYKFEICAHCGKKGTYEHHIVVYEKPVTYQYCRYCGHTKIVEK